MTLKIDDDGRVRVVRIDRPDALNAMNNAVFGAIRDALEAAQDDDQIAVVVLTGSGDRAFSAGQDLTEILAGSESGPHQFPSMLEVELQLVDRVVSSETDELTAVVEQLFVGATSDEEAAGLQSSFSTYTAGQFEGVGIGADGVVVVNLGPGFLAASNFSTSFMSGQVFNQIATTMFAMPEVAGIEFTFDGQRWCGWEAGPCESVPYPVIPRP